MCGIVGCIAALKDEEVFNTALNNLTHRGPDGYGVWKDDEFNVMFGHRRLSILDLSAKGGQPMHYGEYVIIFNGEIYNFLELKRKLEQKGYRFQTESDTEVILAAYATWGKDCLNRFNGMWAFAIWDKRKKELFLARDRFGIKPLFYTLMGRGFFFASEMKGIIPFLPEVKPSIDFDYCRNNPHIYESSSKCLIEGIQRFPPGHYAVFRPGDKDLPLVRYWNTLDNLVEVPESYDEQVEMFRDLFIDACRLRMRSDVPVGTALSGGLDSSATACAMKYIKETETNGGRLANDWQNAFVASFPGTFLDETVYAKEVVNYTGIKGHYIDMNSVNQPGKLIEDLYYFEELYTTSPRPMIALYKKLRDHNVLVTIDGHGADELLAGYGFSIINAFSDCRGNIKEIKEVADVIINRRSKVVSDGKELKSNKLRLIEFGRYLARHKAIDTLHSINHIPFLKGSFKLPVRNSPFIKRLGYLNSNLYDLFEFSVMPTLLRNYDRYSMANGVEIRMPFLDYRIVTFLLSAPWTSKIRNGYNKAILRDSMENIMPQSVVRRKTKIGFGTPFADWMKNEWKEFLLDTIQSSDFRNCTLIDSVKTEEVIMQVLQSGDKYPKKNAEKAWYLLTPFLWEQALIKGKVNIS